MPFELHILGPTELRGSRPDWEDANVWPAKRLALLAYLALATADGYRRRDQIIGLFWPDLGQEGARAQLRKALSALRESLGPDVVITRGEGEVRLDYARIWCDAVALGQHVREARWVEALALYRGELLEGLFPEGVAQEFEEWLHDTRKALREQAALAAWECSRIDEARGDRKAAAVKARRALELTPDDEDGVRRLMDLLDRHGDRAGALRVYSEWQARKQAEYGVEPAPETRKLARKVQAARKGESHPTPSLQQSLPSVPHDAPEVAGAPARHAGPLRPIAVGAAIVLVIVAVGVALLRDSVGGAAPSASSVAVLPLRVIGDVGLGSAAEAIAEELTTALALVPGLAVRSAARAQQAVGAGGDADRLGRRLRVAYVVDRGLQGGAGRLRLTLRLVRTSDAMAVWAGTYDANDGDVLAFPQRVAGEGTTAIRTRILRPDATADSTPP